MNEKELLNYYRNNYQIAKFDLYEKDRELEEFKKLCEIQSDIIDTMKKRLKQKEKDFEKISIDTLKNLKKTPDIKIIKIR